MQKVNKINKKIIKIAYLLIVFTILISLVIPQFVVSAAEPDLVVEITESADVDLTIKCYPDPSLNDEKTLKLWKLLDMTIYQDGVEIFKGKSDEIPNPLIKAYKLKQKETTILDVKVNFSKEADNEVQGIPFKMFWNFEANGENGAKINLSTNSFYYNGNINPGDLLEYTIIIDNNGDVLVSRGPKNDPGTVVETSKPAPTAPTPTTPVPVTVDTGVEGANPVNEVSTLILGLSLLLIIIIVCIILVQSANDKKNKKNNEN